MQNSIALIVIEFFFTLIYVNILVYGDNMFQIVAATNNSEKLREIREILGNNFEILSLKDEGVAIEIQENGDSFFENALIKAKTISILTGKPSLADDSGLIVGSLGGAPGIFSARYGGEECDSILNRKKLLKELNGIIDRNASFHSTVVLYFPSGEYIFADGIVDGYILEEERGDYGFGYDSLFFAYEIGKSFAEATPQEKNEISHRGRALNKLLITFEQDYLKRVK